MTFYGWKKVHTEGPENALIAFEITLVPNEAKDALNGGKAISKISLTLIWQEAPNAPLVSLYFLNDKKSF